LTAASFIQADGLGRHGWARTLGVLAITVGAGVAAALAVRGLVFPLLKTGLSDAPETLRSGALALTAGGIFACALLGLLVGTRWLHGRPVRSLVTSAPPFRYGHLLLGLVLSAGLVGVTAYVMDPAAIKPLNEVPMATLAIGFLGMLIGFSIQAPMEEILFRGYILQVAWRGFRSVWAAAGISALLFSLAHLGYNLESALFSLTSAIGLTVIVLLLGGLEFSMGAHIGNNLIIAFLFQDLSRANEDATAGIAWDELGANAGVMLALVAVAFVLRRLSREAPDSRAERPFR